MAEVMAATEGSLNWTTLAVKTAKDVTDLKVLAELHGYGICCPCFGYMVVKMSVFQYCVCVRNCRPVNLSSDRLCRIHL